MADDTRNGSFSPHLPATTPEDREDEMIALAVECAEEQMRDRRASSAVIAHYLKLGSSREKLEQERLRGENNLLRAKAEILESQKKIEAIYAEAIEAMRSYSPSNEPIPNDVEYHADEFD